MRKEKGKMRADVLQAVRKQDIPVQIGARVDPSSKYFNAFGTNFFTSP